MVGLESSSQSLAHVAHKVPTIGDLDGLRSGSACGLGISTGPVTADDLCSGGDLVAMRPRLLPPDQVIGRRPCLLPDRTEWSRIDEPSSMSVESSTYKGDSAASGYKLVQHISDVFSTLAAAHRALLSVF